MRDLPKEVAVGLLLVASAGCAGNIEPTNLSAITTESDRRQVDEFLGSPLAVEKANDLVAVAYGYDKGYSASCSRNTGRFFGAPAGPERIDLQLLRPLTMIVGQADRALECVSERSGARETQRGNLAAIFDADRKLAFLGKLDSGGGEVQRGLRDMLADFAAGAVGNGRALFRLSRVALDPDQATAMLEKAAAAGHGEALFRLSRASSRPERGVALLERAVAAGHPRARRAVADLKARSAAPPSRLADPSPTPPTHSLHARETYVRHLAGANCADAGARGKQFSLGADYDMGNGVDRDIRKSVFWYGVAARNGHPDGRYWYDALSKALWPWERAEVKRQVDAWERDPSRCHRGRDTMRFARVSPGSAN